MDTNADWFKCDSNIMSSTSINNMNFEMDEQGLVEIQIKQNKEKNYIVVAFLEDSVYFQACKNICDLIK